MRGVTFRPEKCHVTRCVTAGSAGHAVCHVRRHVSVTHPGNSVTYGVTLVNVTDTPTPKGCPCHVGRLEKAPTFNGWLALWSASPHTAAATHCTPDSSVCWPLSADRTERDTAQSRHSARNRPLLTSTYGHAADCECHGVRA